MFAVFASHFGRGSTVYFRIFGWGLYLSWRRKPLFSERFGFRYVWRIGHLAIELLRPHRMPGQ